MGFERVGRVGGEFPAEFDRRSGPLKAQGAAGVLCDGDEDVGREAGEAVAVDDALHGLVCVRDHVNRRESGGQFVRYKKEVSTACPEGRLAVLVTAAA